MARILHGPYNQREMTRSLLYAALAAAAGLSLAACNKAEPETVDTSGPLFVRAEPVRLDSIRSSVTVTGTVTPAPGADWTIAAPESGRVVEMPKAEGDLVKEGDLLARFEVPSLLAELAARQSEMTLATSRLDTAKSNATRLTALFERGIASQRESDDARRELMEAEAAIGQAMSGKLATEALAGRLVLKARFAGVVARRWHNPGDPVQAGDADPVIRVIDPDRLEIVASIPAAQLSLVGPGRVARIFNPIDASLVDGTVVSIPPPIDAVTAASDVRVSFPKTAALAVGAVVQLEIMSDERQNVMVVPTSAVLHDGMDAYVMVAGTDGKAHRKSVVIGLVARERTQIASGLAVGEHVILVGPEPIPDGAAITIQK